MCGLAAVAVLSAKPSSADSPLSVDPLGGASTLMVERSVPPILPSNVHRLWPPLLVSLALFAVCVAVFAIPGAWMLLAILYVGYSGFSIAAAALLLVAVVFVFWRRHWISGAAMLIGISLVAGSAIVPIPADSISRKAAELVGVVCYYRIMQGQLEEQKKNGVSPAIAVISIDGFGSMTSGIAYDPTGEILLPPASRSKSWVATAGQTELGLEGLEARHIIGNYYSWFHY